MPGVLLLFGSVLILGPQLSAINQNGDQFWAAAPPINFNLAAPPGECTPWKKVNTNGFGLPSEFDESGQPIIPISDRPFEGEEGFEVLVFNDQLYLGMEADNILGSAALAHPPRGHCPSKSTRLGGGIRGCRWLSIWCARSRAGRPYRQSG